jgi:hypothetical protein
MSLDDLYAVMFYLATGVFVIGLGLQDPQLREGHQRR